jgi:hypothetical protein
MVPDNPIRRLTLTQSLFPGTRELLAEDDFRRALDFIAPKDARDRYRDAVDFLFCELQTGYRDVCRRFYAGRLPPLCKQGIATPERAKRWDMLSMGALLLADELRKQRSKVDWGLFRDLVIEAAIAPA